MDVGLISIPESDTTLSLLSFDIAGVLTVEMALRSSCHSQQVSRRLDMFI